jgi:hypothetical protein
MATIENVAIALTAEASIKVRISRAFFIVVPPVGAVYEDVKKCSLFDVQLSSVIFGGAFGAASLTKHCAKRHHRWHMTIEH